MRVGDLVANGQRTGFDEFVGGDRPKRMLVRGGERLLIAVSRFKRQVPQMKGGSFVNFLHRLQADFLPVLVTSQNQVTRLNVFDIAGRQFRLRNRRINRFADGHRLHGCSRPSIRRGRSKREEQTRAKTHGNRRAMEDVFFAPSCYRLLKAFSERSRTEEWHAPSLGNS